MKKSGRCLRRTDPAMPKRLSVLLAAVAVALAVAACGGNNNSSAPPPTSGPSFSPSPNPNNHHAVVEVSKLGTPEPRVPVQISTPASKSSPRPGAPFETVKTNHHGKAFFYHLDPTKTYCWVAILSATQTSSTCANWTIWQISTVSLGT